MYGERRLSRGWHVQSDDRHLLESPAGRHPVRRIQLVYVLRLREGRLHRHGGQWDVHSGRPMPQRHVQQHDRHVREHARGEQYPVQRRQPMHPDRYVSGRLLHGDQPCHVPERRMQRGRDVPAGDGGVLGRDAADWWDLHGREPEHVRHLFLRQRRVHGNQHVHSVGPVPRSRVPVGELHEHEYCRRDDVRRRRTRDGVRERRLSVSPERPDHMPFQWGHGMRRHNQRRQQLRRLRHDLRQSRSGTAQLHGKHVRRVG